MSLERVVRRNVLWTTMLSAAFGIGVARSQSSLPTPEFHHLHLNSTDPESAIAFYVRQFPSTSRTNWAGVPALASPNDVLVLFDSVVAPPAADPEATAFWHFGWHVTDVREKLSVFQQRPEVTLAPFYTGDGNTTVFISSDTWPGAEGSFGRTLSQIEDAKRRGVEPSRVGGAAYLYGPDGALVEYAGDRPAERFDHVHLYQEDPLCAQLWYAQHLNAVVRAGTDLPVASDCAVPRTAEPSWPALYREGTFRSPSAGVLFGDVSLRWYMRQTDVSLLPTRGCLMDHIALSVRDLDAWITKLRGENVRFLEQEYQLGGYRAVMIEGPSREAIELVEIR